MKYQEQRTPGNARYAGFGIESELTKKMVTLARAIDDSVHDITMAGDSVATYKALALCPRYNDDNVFLKLTKVGKRVSTFFSSDGSLWEPVKEDFEIDFGERPEIFLFAYSTDDKKVSAQFYDLEIVEN